jgi:exodeoxyribonuclease VII small subunit
MSKKDNSFEGRVEKSKEILSKLMQPDITLSDSVELYQNGIKELDEASKMLEEATIKYEEIKKQHG